MVSEKVDAEINSRLLRRLARNTKEVFQEPIMKSLLEQSVLTRSQLETLLIDLVIEDRYGEHIPYDEKASLRSKPGTKSLGISRGAFNRTLNQARRNITRCLYTMLLLAYLGLFEYTIFRPFEEIAGRIGNYRQIRDILAGKASLTKEDLESYHVSETIISTALNDLALPHLLKSELSKKKISTRPE